MTRSHRPLIMGRRGAVASNHPDATRVGLDMLRAGGNAVDAAAAISLALGVVEPAMSGLGGDGFYTVWTAAEGRARVYNGTGTAGWAATREVFEATGIANTGPRSVSVPGGLAALALMHRTHGGKPWGDIVAPAIDLASAGFCVTHAYRHYARLSVDKLRACPISRTVYLHDGEIPALGHVIVQQALADSLRAVAEEGEEGFYRGTFAGRLSRVLGGLGVLVDADDLAACAAEAMEPIEITYRGHRVLQTPPNSMGFTLLQELKIAERFDLAALEPTSAPLVHLLVEAKKRAFVDRERFAADPRTMRIPIDDLLSDDHAAELAASIDPDQAAVLPVTLPAATGGDTTYFCVADSEGNGVSAIQSINGAFGSGVTAGDTGILLNNRMSYWHLDPSHPNALAPGKRVRHTMNAPIVLRDGRPWAFFGTPGADNQVQVNLQVLVAMIDHGLDPQAALELPRWTSAQVGQDANWPHAGADSLTVEASYPPATLDGLRRRGHPITTVPPLEGPCSVECIRVLETGVLMAASDPRRDGWAAAY